MFKQNYQTIWFRNWELTMSEVVKENRLIYLGPELNADGIKPEAPIIEEKKANIKPEEVKNKPDEQINKVVDDLIKDNKRLEKVAPTTAFKIKAEIEKFISDNYTVSKTDKDITFREKIKVSNSQLSLKEFKDTINEDITKIIDDNLKETTEKSTEVTNKTTEIKPDQNLDKIADTLIKNNEKLNNVKDPQEKQRIKTAVIDFLKQHLKEQGIKNTDGLYVDRNTDKFINDNVDKIFALAKKSQEEDKKTADTSKTGTTTAPPSPEQKEEFKDGDVLYVKANNLNVRRFAMKETDQISHNQTLDGEEILFTIPKGTEVKITPSINDIKAVPIYTIKHEQHSFVHVSFKDKTGKKESGWVAKDFLTNPGDLNPAVAPNIPTAPEIMGPPAPEKPKAVKNTAKAKVETKEEVPAEKDDEEEELPVEKEEVKPEEVVKAPEKVVEKIENVRKFMEDFAFKNNFELTVVKQGDNPTYRLTPKYDQNPDKTNKELNKYRDEFNNYGPFMPPGVFNSDPKDTTSFQALRERTIQQTIATTKFDITEDQIKEHDKDKVENLLENKISGHLLDWNRARMDIRGEVNKFMLDRVLNNEANLRFYKNKYKLDFNDSVKRQDGTLKLDIEWKGFGDARIYLWTNANGNFQGWLIKGNDIKDTPGKTNFQKEVDKIGEKGGNFTDINARNIEDLMKQINDFKAESGGNDEKKVENKKYKRQTEKIRPMYLNREDTGK